MEKPVKTMFSAFLMLLLYASSSSTISAVNNDKPDFFYLVLQWPGAQCSTKKGCCQPKTAKHARDFIIAGFQPFNFTGIVPEYCDSNTRFNISKISHLVTRLETHWPSLTCPTRKSEKLWSNEWRKYGTCSESILSVHGYFRAALTLRKSANLLKVLGDAGIRPNGSSYRTIDIASPIITAGLHSPEFKCIKDKSGKLQLHQVVLCSDSTGKSFVGCPGTPTFPNGCSGIVKFSHF